MLEALRNDLKAAMRGLRSARMVSAIAVASLAIGIAANTTVFTLVQALEFPRLIYPQSSRIVFLESKNTTRSLTGMLVSAPDALDIATSSETLESVSLTADQSSVLRVADVSRRVSGRRVWAAFFDTMHVPAALGRVLTTADQPGVIVLSDALWRSAFAADPTVIGRSARLDGGSVEIIGVMPPRFDDDAEFWTPLPQSLSGFTRDDRQLTVFARLRDGATFEAAARELDAISNRLALEHAATNKDWRVYPIRIAQLHGRDSRQTFLLLQAAVGFLLLIACANIANILLARGTERRYDVALRVSLGASRGRIMRAVLVEAVVLSIAGGSLGVLLSIWGIRFARRLGGFPDVLDPQLNLLVLVFSAAITILTGLLCGFAPAWRAASISPEAILRSAGRGTHTKGRLRATLAAAQVAAALVLATCAVLMLQTLINREQVPLGFDPAGAVRAELALPWDRYSNAEVGRAAVQRTLENIARQPDVAWVGAITWALPTAAGSQRALTVPGSKDEALPASVRRSVEAITPGYLKAMGIPLRAGRDITATDGPGTAPVALVNEELARRLWPNANPVGQLLRLGTVAEGAPVATIAGVVATVRRSPMHDAPTARVYVAFAQFPNRTVTIVARASAAETHAAKAIGAGIRETDPALLAEQMKTVEADVAQFLAPVRLLTVLLGGFGVIGVLLAALGVFGTMSYTISQQRGELAIRSALGASPIALLRFAFGGAARMTGAGIITGTACALLATRSLRAYLFGVAPADARTYTLTAVLLFVVAMAACYRPARSAASIDPATVLRG